jgi:EAL domain-containing protein (putative c-di-GMP-specific phosphodiesterase class I)
VLSLCVGIAVSGAPDTSSHDLLRDGSLAMQRAKRKGGARFEILDPQLRRQAIGRLGLEARLREAAAEGELAVYYQPEVQLDTGEILGMEALVRWHHPTQGLLNPDEFISVAEDTGLIIPIGRRVLEEACAAAARMEREGLVGSAFTVNVNVSVAQLQNDPDFLDHTALVLAKNNLAPHRLTLEITETTKEIEPLGQMVERLRVVGVGLALDDFGTGYSSLSRLTSLPVSMVKVDQRFVRGIADPANLAIVHAVVDLAAALGMEVTAEGIETDHQLELVRAAGCRRGQGHFFCPAVPEGLFVETLRAGVLPRASATAARSTRPAAARRRHVS